MDMLKVEENPVILLKGGGRVQRGQEVIGTTEEGEVWIAHTVFWDETLEQPMLWMTSVMSPSVGAWAELRHTKLTHGEPMPRKFRAYW